MIEKIKIELDKYLEFDSNELFMKPYVDMASVFGGSLRDIVAGKSDKINDIDIIGLPISLSNISRTLEYYGYESIELVKPDIYTIYKDIKYIFYPITFINKNKKIVQLIRPHNQNLNSSSTEFKTLKNNYYKLLSNVDLTSSGLFYDGYELFESINNAYIHCKFKIYDLIEDAMMYDVDRTFHRYSKLNRNGWRKLDESNKLLIRSLKINKLKNNNIKTLNDYINKTSEVKESRFK